MTESKSKVTQPVSPNLTGEYLGDSDARNFAVEKNDLDGYIGVSAEYMTYADDTHRPYSTPEEIIPTVEQLSFDDVQTDAASSSDDSDKQDSKMSSASK